jgi:hypothetical protein
MRARRPLMMASIAVAAVAGPAVALAVPPGGPVENPLGATVTVASATVAAGGTVTFTGAGYDAAEHV